MRLVPLLEQVLEKNSRKVKLAFKNFPLPNHKFAHKAAIAALAADRQGKFWEYHDRLFENYNKLNDRKIQEIASQVGLDSEWFNKEMKNPEIRARVQRDIREAARVGVRGTPAIFINGRLLKNRSANGIQILIDKELKKVGSPK